MSGLKRKRRRFDNLLPASSGTPKTTQRLSERAAPPEQNGSDGAHSMHAHGDNGHGGDKCKPTCNAMTRPPRLRKSRWGPPSAGPLAATTPTQPEKRERSNRPAMTSSYPSQPNHSVITEDVYEDNGVKFVLPVPVHVEPNCQRAESMMALTQNCLSSAPTWAHRKHARPSSEWVHAVLSTQTDDEADVMYARARKRRKCHYLATAVVQPIDSEFADFIATYWLPSGHDEDFECQLDIVHRPDNRCLQMCGYNLASTFRETHTRKSGDRPASNDAKGHRAVTGRWDLLIDDMCMNVHASMIGSTEMGESMLLHCNLDTRNGDGEGPSQTGAGRAADAAGDVPCPRGQNKSTCPSQRTQSLVVDAS